MELYLDAQRPLDQHEVQTETSSFNSLPHHLQYSILVASGAPLTTCKVAALIAHDSQLTAQWLLATSTRPSVTAAMYGLWEACQHLVNHHGQHTKDDLYLTAYLAATAGELELLDSLLKAIMESDTAQGSATPGQEELHADVVQQAYLEAASSGLAGSCKLLQEYYRRLVPSRMEEGGALRAAVMNGHADVVSTMLSACNETLDPGDYQRLQQTVLRAACRLNQPAVATAVLSGAPGVVAGCSTVTAVSSPLALALKSQAWDVLRVLLTYGAHVEGDADTESALAYAARELGWKAGVMACSVLLESDRMRVGGSELVAGVRSHSMELLNLLLASEASMATLAKQDEQHRGECLGRALAAAVDTKQRDMVTALLAPPPHWGPVTAVVIEPGLNQAAYMLERGKDMVGHCCACHLPVACHDVCHSTPVDASGMLPLCAATSSLLQTRDRRPSTTRATLNCSTSYTSC
jgi:hypothetical protein